MGGIFQANGIDSCLRDESCLGGQAEAIAFPETLEEVQKAMIAAQGKSVVFQGARTGLCGGAVPGGGLIINFTKMTGISDFSYDPVAGIGSITLQAGVTLEQLNAILEKKKADTGLFDEQAQKSWLLYQQAKGKLMFRPNPSEQSATLGGIAATGATGSRRRNGTPVAVKDAILDLVLVLPTGQLLHAGAVGIEKIFGPGSHDIDGMEVIPGCEGLFGAIAELKLALEKKPAEQYGLMAFFPDCRQIPVFMRLMENSLRNIASGVQIMASDFFDESCAAFAENSASLLPELGRYPGFPPGSTAALWLELGGTEEALFAALEAVMVNLEDSGALADKTLAATEGRDFERMGRLRHLLTEAFNLFDAGTPPVLFDLIVPEQEWPEAVLLISSKVREKELNFTLMGHAGDGRLSLRLPGKAGKIQALPEELTAQFAVAGYRCSREHGIGRIKKNAFRLLCREEAALMTKLKKHLDPSGLINGGVMLDLSGRR